MDTCVALVQAYLHVNGYFTVAEYPVFEKWGVETQAEPQSRVPHQRRTNGGVRVRRNS